VPEVVIAGVRLEDSHGLMYVVVIGKRLCCVGLLYTNEIGRKCTLRLTDDCCVELCWMLNAGGVGTAVPLCPFCVDTDIDRR